MRVAVAFDSDGSCAVIGEGRYDLRANPQAIERIEPARRHAPLRAFLAHVNSADSIFLTFGCKAWSATQAGTAEAHLFASRVDLVFLREADNFGRGPLSDVAHRVAQLLECESEAIWADLSISPARFAAENIGYCIRLSVYAGGSSPQQAEVRWGLAMAHAQQALLFASRALRQQQ
jgi:hypothetical protein